jgi:hypothetical protein
MQPKEIKLILGVLDLPMTSVAKQIGCSKGDLSATINDLRPNQKVRRKLADFLSETIRERVLNPHPAASP